MSKPRVLVMLDIDGSIFDPKSKGYLHGLEEWTAKLSQAKKEADEKEVELIIGLITNKAFYGARNVLGEREVDASVANILYDFPDHCFQSYLGNAVIERNPTEGLVGHVRFFGTDACINEIWMHPEEGENEKTIFNPRLIPTVLVRDATDVEVEDKTPEILNLAALLNVNKSNIIFYDDKKHLIELAQNQGVQAILATDNINSLIKLFDAISTLISNAVLNENKEQELESGTPDYRSRAGSNVSTSSSDTTYSEELSPNGYSLSILLDHFGLNANVADQKSTKCQQDSPNNSPRQNRV